MKDFREVIADYLEGKSHGKCKLLLDSWISRDQDNKHSLQQIFDKLQQAANNAETYNPNTQKAYEEILLKINSKKSATTVSTDFSYNNPSYRSIAAIMTILIIAAIAFFIYPPDTPDDWLTVNSSDENKEFFLNDGTHVWLNKGSILKYPASFNNNSRDVILSGEGFFEVTENEEQPFIIKTAANSIVEVKGTSFNIRCYEDDKTEEIAVMEGTVVYKCSKDSRPQVAIKKGECAMWNMQSDNIERTETVDPNTFSWKDNILQLDSVDCQTLEKSLERFFHVEVMVKDPVLYNKCNVSAIFEDKSLSDVLSYLQEYAGIHADVKKDTCFLWGKFCKDECDD
ncbi:MAG: hypothetical protein CMO01_32155 [Thalassobius sp.]|nr:hypothetical protein [Thalassovita sp.]